MTGIGPDVFRSGHPGAFLSFPSRVVASALDAGRAELEAPRRVGVFALGLRACRWNNRATGAGQPQDCGAQAEAASRAAPLLRRVLSSLRLRAGSGVAVPAAAEGKDRAILPRSRRRRSPERHLSDPAGAAGRSLFRR